MSVFLESFFSLFCVDYCVSMEKDSKLAVEDAKLDLFEDDDEFEEF